VKTCDELDLEKMLQVTNTITIAIIIIAIFLSCLWFFRRTLVGDFTYKEALLCVVLI
jgi:hypothetical protein